MKAQTFHSGERLFWIGPHTKSLSTRDPTMKAASFGVASHLQKFVLGMFTADCKAFRAARDAAKSHFAVSRAAQDAAESAYAAWRAARDAADAGFAASRAAMNAAESNSAASYATKNAAESNFAAFDVDQKASCARTDAAKFIFAASVSGSCALNAAQRACVNEKKRLLLGPYSTDRVLGSCGSIRLCGWSMFCLEGEELREGQVIS